MYRQVVQRYLIMIAQKGDTASEPGRISRKTVVCDGILKDQIIVTNELDAEGLHGLNDTIVVCHQVVVNLTAVAVFDIDTSYLPGDLVVGDGEVRRRRIEQVEHPGDAGRRADVNHENTG